MDGAAVTRRVDAKRLIGFDAKQWLRSEAVRFAILPSACAWLALSILPIFSAPSDICSFRIADSTLSLSTYLFAQARWCLMVIAMMLPLAVPQLKILAARSASDRKHRSVAIFATGFVVAWFSAGLAITAVMQLAGILRPGEKTATTLFYLVAIAWQISTAKKRALNKCHFVAPVRAWGHAADLDALHNGLRHGRYCVESCLLTMLPLSASGMGATSMTIFFALLLAERADHRPKFGQTAIVMILLWVNEIA